MVISIKDALKIGKDMLVQNDIDSREARLLLSYTLNVESSELVRIDICDKEQFDKFIEYIKRRVSGEPYAYIVGHKEFMKLDFIVNENVLIPREDTEILVLEAIKHKKQNILDLCTGSGCIAISLAKYIENSKVDAVDISSKALEVARENAAKNCVQIGFIESNLFENVNKRYDMIVSNPPYIRTDIIEKLQDEVKKEPYIALDGGTTGLDFYEKILSEAKKYLNEDGVILFEIGYDQGKSVTKLMEKYNYKNIKVIKDLSDNDRVLFAERG